MDAMEPEEGAHKMNVEVGSCAPPTGVSKPKTTWSN